MKKLIAVLVLSVLVGAPTLGLAEEKPSLFVNLTSDDPWTAGMAVGFATKNLEAGHPVTVFLNVRGVHLAVKSIPQHVNGVTGKTVQTMLRGFMSKGGKVIVCPMCLRQSGFAADDLIDNAKVGGPAVTFPALYGSDKVISY